MFLGVSEVFTSIKVCACMNTEGDQHALDSGSGTAQFTFNQACIYLRITGVKWLTEAHYDSLHYRHKHILQEWRYSLFVLSNQLVDQRNKVLYFLGLCGWNKVFIIHSSKSEKKQPVLYLAVFKQERNSHGHILEKFVSQADDHAVKVLSDTSLQL